MNWPDEQRDYMLSKEQSQEMAAFCIAMLFAMILIGLAVEAWMRIFP